MRIGIHRTVGGITICLCLLLAAIVCAAEDDAEVVAQFEKGKRLMRQGDWMDAIDLFKELEARYPESEYLDLFVFNRAKARYYLGEYDEAIAGLNYYVSRFPHSDYLAHAHYFLGNALYRDGDIDRAIRSYLRAYRHSDDERLNKLLLAALDAAFRNASRITLGPADFEALTAEKRCKVITPLVTLYVEREEGNRARELAQMCQGVVGVDSTFQAPTRLHDSQLDIAMVLPLSGELNSYGQELYNGAAIAAAMFTQEHGGVISLEPFDTKGDPIEAARIVRELSGSTATDIVIGPLTSDEAMVASAVLSCSSLPLIAPAATASGLTRFSNTTFQLSPNIDLEGITLADYAFYTLNLDSAAIISSLRSDDVRVARAFADRFRAIGGTVIAAEYYGVRDKDFGEYIRDIKAVVHGAIPDSIFYTNAEGDTLDLDVIPVHVDAIFVAGEPRQLRQLIPQIHFYNLSGQYLGSDGWGDAEVYKLGEDITKEAVIASTFVGSRASEEYTTLAAAYDHRYGQKPERLATLGYDAVRIVAARMQSEFTRENIASHLQSIQKYAGASGAISFGAYRENIEMPLYRIENGRLVPITDFRSTTPER